MPHRFSLFIGHLRQREHVPLSSNEQIFVDDAEVRSPRDRVKNIIDAEARRPRAALIVVVEEGGGG